MNELKPNVVQEIERYHLSGIELKELVKDGFLAAKFLGGEPGTGQEVHYQFSPEFERLSMAVVITVTTLRQPYTDRT